MEITSRLPNASFWKNKSVLITGHTGFKGAWLSLWLTHLGAKVTGIALPVEQEESVFTATKVADTLTSYMADIRDLSVLQTLVNDTEPEIILHMAAQSLVLEGYQSPVDTYATNVMGTIHLLEAIRQCPSAKAVVVVTSDKVYANDNKGEAFSEQSRLGGNDPYSNSKACTELVTQCWQKSFLAEHDVRIATARAGNVFGGGDIADNRLIPDYFRSITSQTPLRLRHPNAVRPWQWVLEPLSGYLLLAESLYQTSQSTLQHYNFGPLTSEEVKHWPVAKVVDTLVAITGNGSWQQDGDSYPQEAQLLMLDASHATQHLQWAPKLPMEEALRWTADWWQHQQANANMYQISMEQIAAYEQYHA